MTSKNRYDRSGPEADDRATTAEMFDPLHAVHRFTVDVCASPDNAKVDRFYSVADDGLAQDWDGEVVWCNPPYSCIEPWVVKAWASAAVVVMLLPANRTEQVWWQDHVEPYRDRGLGLTCTFLRGRPRFLSPGQTFIGPQQRPPFGCVLLTWDGHEPRRSTLL